MSDQEAAAQSQDVQSEEQKMQNGTGLKAVLERSMQSYEKLPMLDIIFQKFIRLLSTSFRNLTSEEVNIEITELSSMRFSNYFATQTNPFSIVVFKAVEWENLGLVVMENKMIIAFVDMLLGGKKNLSQQEEQLNIERPLTSIEQGIAKQLSEVILGCLSQSFDQISPTTFSFERLESNPNFINLARPGDPIISLSLKIEIDNHHKRLDLVIPYKTIEPIKEMMQQVFIGDKFGNDNEWEQRLHARIDQIDLPIDAIIPGKISNIKEIFALKVGDTFILDHNKDEDVCLRCGPVSLFNGSIGQTDGKMAIKIRNAINN